MEIIELVGISVLLIGVSATFSGLNLSLMSLSIGDLTRKARLGDKQAARVLPLRRNSHLSLASILLGNVGAISATSLVMEGKFNGVVAGIISTLLIVIFGEILPQAFFMQRSLAVTSLLAPVLRVLIVITYPIAKPLQILLDRLFPPSEGGLHTRHELGLIISEHIDHAESELDESEVEIIRGALKLSEKKVGDIMTPIKDVYWLKLTDKLDGDSIDQVKLHNWSRIPIFNKQLTECYGLLLMKDLVDIDFDERSYKVRELTLRRTEVVGEKTALDTIFRKFIAARTHLMPVIKGSKITGVLSIEDVVEEIIGQEIEDETDGVALKRHGAV